VSFARTSQYRGCGTRPRGESDLRSRATPRDCVRSYRSTKRKRAVVSSLHRTRLCATMVDQKRSTPGELCGWQAASSSALASALAVWDTTRERLTLNIVRSNERSQPLMIEIVLYCFCVVAIPSSKLDVHHPAFGPDSFAILTYRRFGVYVREKPSMKRFEVCEQRIELAILHRTSRASPACMFLRYPTHNASLGQFPSQTTAS
jgi:hypothetical protein